MACIMARRSRGFFTCQRSRVLLALGISRNVRDARTLIAARRAYPAVTRPARASVSSPHARAPTDDRGTKPEPDSPTKPDSMRNASMLDEVLG